MEPTGPGTDALVGRRIADRFVIRALLARGAMGRVYEAEQVPLGRRVAVKFLDVRSSGESTSDWVDRFRREAASLAALTSPHTVRIIDYGWWEGLTYLVMEYIDGIPLSRILQEGPLEPSRAIDIALQICDSLQEAHARGLVHRDLKPDNILLTRIADGREWAKVIDWGLVKDLYSDQEHTNTGMLLGTPSYMAPEQIRGEALDGRVDLYALGVVLFRMLTGKKPFDQRSTTAGVLLTHLQEPPASLRDAYPQGEFPDALDMILQRSLAKRRSERYSSASELARDLQAVQRLVRGEPTVATSLSDLPSASRVSSAMSLSLAAPHLPPQPSPRRSLWWVGGVVVTALIIVTTAAAAGVFFAVMTAGPASAPRVEISGSITENTTWTQDNVYVLTDPVFVESGTLTIEAGTTVLGDESSALVITQGATIRARGRADAPIVFTSARPEGERAPGDWGGLVMLGDAPVNVDTGRGFIEGVENEEHSAYGGVDATSNCGILEFVRIEFAGREAWTDNELNGLTLGGCGTRTIVRNVQVHRTLDDGIELFGGTAALQNVLITSPGDDGLDWDQGWTGRAQFVVIQLGEKNGDNAIEADSSAPRPDKALPRSAPHLSHFTLIGGQGEEVAQRGVLLRRGTAGILENFIVVGFQREALDIRDAVTAKQANVGKLVFRNSLLFKIGSDGNAFFPEEKAEQDDDGGFDEAAWADFRAEDPKLPTRSFDPANPEFVPSYNSPSTTGAHALPDEEFWDAAASWIGAVRPGSPEPWYRPWAAFPEN